MRKQGVKVIAQNRKARHDYFIEESFEAGMALVGTEVKSIRQGRCNMKDCYAAVKDGEMYVFNMHISPYEQGNRFNVDPLRPKKLLMHKTEIRKLQQVVMQKGLSLIPLSVYLKDNIMKMELAVCRGKKLFDKRDDMKDKDTRREIERHMKDRTRS